MVLFLFRCFASNALEPVVPHKRRLDEIDQWLAYQENIDQSLPHFNPVLRLHQSRYDTREGCMPRKEIQKSDKIPRTVYLTAKTSQRLDQAAAEEGMSYSIYIELALKDRFKKDGIK
jgi:hypothetical protein